MAKKKSVALAELLGRDIVIDTQSSMIAIGKLILIAEDSLVLEDADVHDRQEGYSTKELYVINACKFGIRVNRKKAYIPRNTIIAVSALEDIIVD